MESMQTSSTSDQSTNPALRAIGGIDIELSEKGKGRTVLFLHPGDGSESSAPFVDALAKKYRVLAPCHPGFGASALPEQFTSVDDISYFYLDLLEQLQIKDA